jgi:hypothetical protein
VAFAADVGAEAGAAELAVGAYSETPLLDPGSAEATAVRAALAARPRSGRSAVATADVGGVCLTVVDHYQPRILGAIGVASTEVTVEACAVPGRG